MKPGNQQECMVLISAEQYVLKDESRRCKLRPLLLEGVFFIGS